MKSGIFKGTLAVLTLAMIVMAATTAQAAVMSVSATAPTIDGADTANFLPAGTTASLDKWWAENNPGAGSAKGQSFTTGSEGVFANSITYQIANTQQGRPTKDYVIRVSTLSGTTLTEIYSETATQHFEWNWDPTLNPPDGDRNDERWMTWTLDSPVFLSPNTVYGIDVGMTSSTSGWRSGIPYITFNNSGGYDGGEKYSTGQNGVGDSEAHMHGGRDRVFHIDMSTGPDAAYWDLAGVAPAGTWDAASANWNSASDGTGTTAAWTAGQKAVFAAGGDATGTYTVTVDGTQDIGGLSFEEGTVTLSGGTALRMTTTTVMNVASGLTASIATPISEDASAQTLVKVGDGTLALSGAGSYSGATNVVSGTLRLDAGNALPVASAVTVGDTGGVASGTLDLNGNSATLGDLTLIEGATVNGSGAATLATAVLTYNAGTMNIAGTALDAEELIVNADLNLSTSTVSSGGVSVFNSTLTLGNDIPTASTLEIDNGSVVGGAVTASDAYYLTNLADYSANITGAAADLIIGVAKAGNAKVKLTGTDNTYGGITRLDSGYLEVSAEAANLGSGQLVFNGGSLQTSGTFTGMLGASNDIRQQVAALKFAATDAPLTVTLERADGTDGPLQFSYGSNTENGTSSITLGSPTSDAMVELTNDLFGGHGAPGGGGQSYHVKLYTVDNPNSSNDVALVSGDITNPDTENLVILEKRGAGTMRLTGTNSGFLRVSVDAGNSLAIGTQNVLSAVDGVGLPPTALLMFNGGVLESSGTFTRQIGSTGGNRVDPGQVYFNKEGGFAAYGGPLTVSLVPTAGGSAGDPLTWNGDLRSKNLYMGSQTADNVATWTNNIDGANGNRNIYVSGNPDSDADHVVFSGNLTNMSSKTLYVRGTANPGELRFNGSVTAGNVRAETGATIGGNGTITGNLVITSTSAVAPGNGVGTLTVTGNTLMQDNSIYEWQVGQDGETDVLNVTGAGTLDLDKFIFKILDADGYVADAANQLPVFTYENGVTTVQEQLADVTFDTSALDAGMWDWSAGLALTDDAGIIYLTGLTGGASVEVLWGGDATGNWANADKWLPVGTPAGTSAAVVDTADAVVSVAAGANARSLDVKQGTVDVQTGVVLGAGNSVSVGTAGTVNVDGTLNASAGNVAGTLGGDGTIDVDTIDVAATGTLNVNGTLNAVTGSVAGTLAGTGTINVGVDSSIEVTGTVAPGGATGVGTLTLGTGKMVLNPAATFNAQVSLASVGPDQVVADQITVSAGNLLMLGGTLAVSGLGDRADSESWADATPTVVLNNGDIGEVGVGGYEFSGVTPQPDPDNPPHLGQGAFLRDVTYESRFDPIVDAVKLDVFVALGGDADGDAKVWLSDWAVLRANFGNTATGKTWTDGNFDSWVDGKVWLSDWAALRANFGNADYTVAEAGASAVPEPGTIAMLLAALGGITIVLRRARASNRPI